MALPTIETVQHRVALAPQSASGTAAAAPFRDLSLTDGQFNFIKSRVTKATQDGNAFSGSARAGLITGSEGTVTSLGLAEEAALCFAAILGGDAVSTDISSGQFVHALTAENSRPDLTLYELLGSTVKAGGQHVDARVQSAKLSMDRENVIAELETSFKAIAVTKDFTIPAGSKAKPPKSQVLTLNGLQELSIGSVDFVAAGDQVHGVDIMVSRETNPQRGNTSRPYAHAESKGMVQVTITLPATAEGLALRNRILFSTPTPADGTAITDDIYQDSLVIYVRTGSGDSTRSLRLEADLVTWDTESELEGSDDGTPTEIVLVGEIEPDADGHVGVFTFVTSDEENYVTGV